MKGRNDVVYATVRRIPRGRVATYGQIALLAGLGRAARQVGYAMYGLPDGTAVPWHRVVNAQGRFGGRPGAWQIEQRIRLEREGVRFGQNGAIDLDRFGWEPHGKATPRRSVRRRSAPPGRPSRSRR